MYILKLYSHPRGTKRGFEYFEGLDWGAECKAERELDYKNGASAMLQCTSKQECIDQARKYFGIWFNNLF